MSNPRPWKFRQCLPASAQPMTGPVITELSRPDRDEVTGRPAFGAAATQFPTPSAKMKHTTRLLQISTRTSCPLRSRTIANTSRAFTTTVPRSNDGNAEGAASNARWLTDIGARIKNLPVQKLDKVQQNELGIWKTYLDANWLLLSAGREGYIMDPKWWGMPDHPIFWGDMVSRGSFDRFMNKR